MKAILWVSSDYAFKDFMRAKNDEERYMACTITNGGYDMTPDGWIKLGEAELTPTFIDHNSVTESAVAAVDRKINSLIADHCAAIQALKDYRNSLLALPSPKEEQE